MHEKHSRKASPAAPRPIAVSRADSRSKKSRPHAARPDGVLADARIKTAAHWHAFRAPARKAGRRTVALDGYLHALVDHLVEIVPVQSRITLLVNADPVQVPARVAGLIGQIVNELVITTVRHACGPTSPGAID